MSRPEEIPAIISTTESKYMIGTYVAYRRIRQWRQT